MAQLFSDVGYWLAVKDGDSRVFDIFQRHYSYKPYADGRRNDQSNKTRFLTLGPGKKLVLLGADCKAIFGWRIYKDPTQTGINCAYFRNESDQLSSTLITQAEELAFAKWGKQRLFTFVNDKKVKSHNPGYCFKMAGWKPCGRTHWNNLLILEKIPQ